MLLLGIDVGTSSIKVSVVDSATSQIIATANYPDIESEILVLQKDWAEQSPEMWWDHVQMAILRCHQKNLYQPHDITAIGIAYQMHGLVLVDEQQQSLRNSIIWCDSRAIVIGDQAFSALGKDFCLQHLLNSPGNFTAAKLSWVKSNEPEIYARVRKMMLPGDFIAMKLTGEITTTISALSEGIFWNFKENEVSTAVLDYFGFDDSIIPELRPLFSEHGQLSADVAAKLNLKVGTIVSYKSGDQPNNALSLNVTQPGEVAATAGTSGVIFGVTDQLIYDEQSRINTFAHVNHTTDKQRLGVLLCINGTGSMNHWARKITQNDAGYEAMNDAAARVKAGSDGLRVLPFGNGAERMLNNKIVGAQIQQLNLNIHGQAQLFRAVQEGIAFSFRYGLDILKANGISPTIIRAGRSNLFKSEVFSQSFVNITGVPTELYENDGSFGAAIGAGIGAGIFKDATEAFNLKRPVKKVEPIANSLEDDYQDWKSILEKHLEP